MRRNLIIISMALALAIAFGVEPAKNIDPDGTAYSEGGTVEICECSDIMGLEVCECVPAYD